MDIDDQQSTRSSSSIEMLDQDDELGEDFKQNLDEIPVDKNEQKVVVAKHCDQQHGNPEQQQKDHEKEVQCQQQISPLIILDEQPQHRPIEPSPAESSAIIAEVSQVADCSQNVVALVEVHRTDIPDFPQTFKYESNTEAGCPTVEKMLGTVLSENLDEIESMDELLEQFDLLKVQRMMEDARTSTKKFYVDISKKQRRVQLVQDGEYRAVLRPKSVSEIGRNPQPTDTPQHHLYPQLAVAPQHHHYPQLAVTPQHHHYPQLAVTPQHHHYAANEPQLTGVGPIDQPVRQQNNNDQTAPRSSVHRYVLSDEVKLGQPYNEHTDNLISANGGDSPAGICSNNFRSSACYFIMENLSSVEQRLQMFDIEQKISIVSKLTEFGEHNVLGNFLRHAEGLSNSTSNSFGILYTSPTKTFELHRDAEQLLLTQQTMMGITDGHHTVRAITYGFVVGAIFTVQQPQQATNKKPLDAKAVQKLVMKRLNNEDMTYTESSLFGTLDNSKVMVTVFSNNNGSNDCVKGKQMSLHSAMELFEAATKKTKSAKLNHGNIGHPISCEVMKLATIVGRDQQQQSHQKAVNAKLFDQMKAHIELVEEVERDNTLIQAHVDEFAHCLREEEWLKIKELGTQFDKLKATFGSILQDAVLQFRDYGGNMALLGDEQLGLDAIHQLHQQMRTCMEVIVSNKAVELCCYLKQKGVRYIGRGNTTLEAELAKTADVVGGQHISSSNFVLFWDQNQAEQGDPVGVQNTKECWALFEKLISARGCTNCMLLDLSLADLPQAIADIVGDRCSTRLIKFIGPTLVVEDYLQEEERKRTVCVARFGDGAVEAVVDGADDLDLVVMPCPNAMFFNGSTSNMPKHFGPGANAGSCPNDDRYWECDECGQYMRLDKSDLNDDKKLWFYCACGRVLVSSLRFRCPCCVASDFCGRPFAIHTLHALRARLRANLGKKSKNILILGETGVGKSTWINALGNYMTYGSLTDAILSDESPVCLIPAEFTITDEKYRPRVVHIDGGSSQAQRDNERHVPGKSCTQGPHTYKFNYLGGELRLIDTAGIGDTDGIEQDKRNFDTLLNFLSNIRELHGVCILLHANKSRLTPAFRYCIGELFSHLHRNAAQNIVFCFTNARSTLYRPGDTLPPLREFLDQLAKDRGIQIELDQSTMYCMDNESFRFLCAVKDGVQFSSDVKANFEESWRRTESETRRMLEYLDQLKPHRTEETTSLNEARRYIFLMAKPLALVARTIQTNISVMNNEKDRLANLDSRVVDFNSQLMIKQVVIETKGLNHPRTVCVAKGCTEVRRDMDGKNRVLYTTHCHPHCYLNNVTLEKYPNPALQGCAAMINKGGQIVCNGCGCSWQMHMHINYEQYEVTKNVEDKKVRDQLQSTNDQRKKKEVLINNVQDRIRRYTEEQGRINAIAAMFASFLQQNAIMPYNDAVREYLQLLIREAKRIADQSQDPEDLDKLAALENFLAEYMEQRNFFEQSLKTGATTIGPQDIKRYFEELKNLPLTGEDIRKLYKQEENGQCQQMSYLESACPTMGRRMRGQKRQKSTTSQRDKSASYDDPSSSSLCSASSSSGSVCPITPDPSHSLSYNYPAPPFSSFFSSALDRIKRLANK